MNATPHNPKLQRFFNRDKKSRKRLRTAIEFVRTSDDANVRSFYSANHASIYSIIMDTVGAYEKLAPDESDLSITERHLPDKLMSKFKKKVIILADWIDVIDLTRGLLIHCSDLIAKGWQRNGLHNFLRRLVHPDATHSLRVLGFHLLLVRCAPRRHVDIACSDGVLRWRAERLHAQRLH